MSELPPSYQRQAPRGKFIDFAPRPARPASRPNAQSTPVQNAQAPVRPQSAPVQVNFSAAETTVVDPHPYPHTVARVSSARITATPVQPQRPLQAPRAPQARPLAQEPVHTESQLERIRKAPRPRRAAYDDYLELEDFDDLTPERTPVAAEADAPDNNRFVLGGKSPFINLDKVPKRPLGPSKKASLEEVTRKNIYARRKAPTPVKDNVPTVVMDSSRKTSNISLVIAIILTVILGAVVGTIAYLAFFQ